MTKARRGIYAAAVTPFDENGRVDQAKLVGYCQHLLSDGGCDGVAPTGTTGEGTSVAMVDRLALPAAFAETGIETDRVIFGTGSPSLFDCVALTTAACDAGFVNALVLPPYYYKGPSDNGLFAYYAFSFYFLYFAVRVSNPPMTCNQFCWHVAGIMNGNGVGKYKATIAFIRLRFDE